MIRDSVVINLSSLLSCGAEAVTVVQIIIEKASAHRNDGIFTSMRSYINMMPSLGCLDGHSFQRYIHSRTRWKVND